MSDVEKIVKERETVIDVNETLEFKGTRSNHEIFHNEFTSQRTTQVFENNTDKHICARSSSADVNVWGISLETDRANTQEGSDKGEEGSYVSSVHYQRIPVQTVDVTPNDMKLRPEVITALQHVEKSLKRVNYKPKDHFKDFFETYGTHVNHGTIEFGGILMSTAYCERFSRRKILAKISAVVKEASQAALLLGYSKKLRPGVPFNAYEVLSKTSGMCAEDLQNITVTIKKYRGFARNNKKEMNGKKE